MLYPNYEPEKGDMLAFGPSMSTECERCESCFVDCEICMNSDVTIMKAHTPERKEVKGEEH